MPIAVRVSSVALPMCGSSVTLGAPAGLGDLRLLGIYVEAGAGDPARRERLDQRASSTMSPRAVLTR